MTVKIGQADAATGAYKEYTLWSVATSGNIKGGGAVPDEASNIVKSNMEAGGVTLVLSLWGGRNMAWLDGGCKADVDAPCDRMNMKYLIQDLRVEDNDTGKVQSVGEVSAM